MAMKGESSGEDVRGKMAASLDRKEARLVDELKQYPSMLVAFSGGVDSAYLLVMAHKVLKNRVTAVTIQSPLHPQRELRFAARFAAERNIAHAVIQTDEIRSEELIANPRDRCYICKKLMIRDIRRVGRDRGIDHIAHGANVDDLNDYRPGMKAAREMNLIAPLLDAGLNKDEIRLLSKKLGLETWDKPAMACLATRIPYGTPIDSRSLGMIESAEDVLFELGIRACRVRHHGDMARIEVSPSEFEFIMSSQMRSRIIDRLRAVGYRFVTLDLEGYVQGSLNR
jgi:uncharacterized protein